MNKIQTELRSLRANNKNIWETNLKEMVDKLIKKVVLQLRKFRNLITARKSRLKDKDAP
jgi:hypothetical protein